MGVEIHYDHSGEIKLIYAAQNTNIIDIDSIKVENIKSKCISDDTDTKCVITQLHMKFLEPLQDNVMAIKAIDFKGRTQITYLNDGFDVSGDSLNPLDTTMIAGTEKYEGLIKVTQIAKYSDIWVANDGRAFEMNESGTFTLINQSIKDKIDTRISLDRYNSEFSDYKETQVDKAVEVLLEMCTTCLTSFVDFEDSFGYDYPPETDRIEKIKYSLELEKLRALEVFEKSYTDNEKSKK